MKRSLKIHIFFHVLVIASLIVFFNRTIAQWLLLDQMKNLLRSGLINSYVACEAEINQPDQFYSCHRKIDPGSILNNFSESYVLCPSSNIGAASARPPECEMAHGASSFWDGAQALNKGVLEIGGKEINQLHWFGVRRIQQAESTGPFLLINEDTASNTVKQMWSYRDRNLVFTLPIIVLMLMMLAIYLTYLLTRAISSLEQALSGLNANNLNEAQQLQAPYREFDNLVSVFEGLRQRLLESFGKTRRFAADASHELRTPLTILRGNSELMINEMPVGSKAYDQVRKIHEEAERLIDITEKLLMLSRADANNILIAATDMPVSEVLEGMIEDSVETFPNVKMTSNIQPSVIWHCDTSLITQLFHNLFANAIKYNKPDGWVHLELQSTSSFLKFKISNSTESVPEDLNERAFERFYRGHFAHSRKADGQGLGLSIAFEIAKVHQGVLSIQGEEGVVTVTLEVPMSTV
jgi:signal transduction histidine kinase